LHHCQHQHCCCTPATFKHLLPMSKPILHSAEHMLQAYCQSGSAALAVSELPWLLPASHNTQATQATQPKVKALTPLLRAAHIAECEYSNMSPPPISTTARLACSVWPMLRTPCRAARFHHSQRPAGQCSRGCRTPAVNAQTPTCSILDSATQYGDTSAMSSTAGPSTGLTHGCALL
jgi:hypothetical protein